MGAQFVDPALAEAAAEGVARLVGPENHYSPERDGDGGVSPARPRAAAGGSILADLAQDFRTSRKSLVLDVPGKPGWEVKYDTAIPWELYRAWTLEATDVTGVDQLELAVRVLTSQAVEVTKNGTVLVAEGKPLTFVDKAFQDSLKAIDPVDAVRKFYGDGVALKAAGLVLTEAGYGAGSDPTSR